MGEYLVIGSNHASALPAAVVLHRPDAADTVVHELAPERGCHYHNNRYLCEFAIILSSVALFFYILVVNV